ncbi:MAG: TrkH family potassium uptake protein [Paludibacteraceae bacterium]|nr:TrkH family potassium uptake protein [Paludibacteraceae bacterium]
MTRAFNKELVFRTMGALLLIETFFMALATGVSVYYSDPDLNAFIVSTTITFLAGLLGLWFGRHASSRVGEREGYVIVAMVWVIFSLFGLLPYYLSGQISSFTDAWFETMSGFTTTGATILNDVESLTHAALFWRAMTQWLGGLGIIVLCVALLPMFGLGGMQLYAAEVTGVNYEKLSPRIADTAKLLWGVYILMTATETLLLKWAGMCGFDALCHSFATIATGGFSTKNTSLMLYGPAVHYIVGIFTFLSGINFALLVHFLRGKPSRLLKDEETRWYVRSVIVCSLALTIGLCVYYGLANPVWKEGTIPVLRHLEHSLRHGFFMAANAITSTGFAASDYMTWHPLLWVMVAMMFITGGSSGSTAGGIKWVRIIIFVKSGVAEFQRRIHPHAIIPIKLNGKPLPYTTINNVMAFMVFYILLIFLSVLVFSACGVNLEESIGVAISSIGNVGMSIGQYGPSGSYALFPTFGKWWMTLIMLTGRLEIFTILLLFTKVLWKK